MAKTDYKSIDEYHKAFPAEMQVIRELVHKIAPEAKEIISYQIPAFRLDDKYNLIDYCAFAKHLTLSSPWSEAMLKEFETELSGRKVSKSAIQFPHDKPLPEKLIKRILKFRKAEYKAKKQNGSVAQQSTFHFHSCMVKFHSARLRARNQARSLSGGGLVVYRSFCK